MSEQKNIKVLFIVTNSFLGGISKFLLEILKNLPEYIEPYYIMGSEGYLSEEIEKLGVSKDKIFYVPMTNNIFDIKQHIKSNIEALKIIKKIKPDLINSNATTASVVSALCGILTKIPVIYSVHGWPFTEGIPKHKQIFYRILDCIICSVFKKITTETVYDRNLGISLMPWLKNRITVMPNGISDIREEYKKNNFSSDELKITMIARYCPQKDQYTLIQAVGELNREGYNIKLDLYGYGEEVDHVEAEIKKYGTANIKNCGPISDDLPIFKNYDIYSLISNWEGFPISIIEAMAAGLPIIISDICGNKELIENNGYLIPRKDINTLKDKIKLLYNNRPLLQKLGKNSRLLYEKDFEAKVMVEKLLNIYKEVING